MNELVLVVPTAAFHEAGLFQGFCNRVDHYLDRLLLAELLRFVPRDEAELDPSWKQLIPYVVLRHAGRVFHYRRDGGGEKRLHARRSIGIGGHVCSNDGKADREAYFVGTSRELTEEVELPGIEREQCIGLINDDSSPVGQVHLGIVHVVDLAAPSVRCREASLVAGGFESPHVLSTQLEEFESWSRFLLEGDASPVSLLR